MMKEETRNIQKMPHLLSLDNRKILSLSGILEVDSFDDKFIVAYTSMGTLTIKGENLNIKKLSLDVGELDVVGQISSLIYTDKKINSGNGLFSKLFK